MATFKERDIAYYLSPAIRENRYGRREKHYHVLCAQFTNRSKRTWLQLIGTSKDIENDYENIIIVEPSPSNPFTKNTRFNCDQIYTVAEKDMMGAKIYGPISDSLFKRLQHAIGESEKITPINKKRMGL